MFSATGTGSLPGVTGELCIGGAGVARGYLDRPDLTVARFVQNPYGPPGDRIYRTGDLARLRASGEFECLGRLDHQVKIRGFRVELGEIECRLDELACVGKSVVTLHAPDDSEPRLVAYVIPADGEDFSPREMTAAAPGLPAVLHDSVPVHPDGIVRTDPERQDRPRFTARPCRRPLSPRDGSTKHASDPDRENPSGHLDPGAGQHRHRGSTTNSSTSVGIR